MTTEEARAAPDIVTGSFVVNYFPVLMIFHSGASRSFVSQFFSRDFDMILGGLDCPMRVSVSNKHKVSTSSIFHDYTLEIFMLLYSIDLNPNPYGGCVCDYGLVE